MINAEGGLTTLFGAGHSKNGSGSVLLFRSGSRGRPDLLRTGSGALRVSRSAERTVFFAQMFPRIAGARHELGSFFVCPDRIPVKAFLLVSQSEVFPHRSITGIKTGAFAQVV